MQPEIIFQIIILVVSVIIHEVSHGWMALALGDPTAKLADRLTLNPIKHLDLFGSVLLPLFLIFVRAGIVVGWAKPVPYNPYNLKYPRWGPALVAGAGPVSNLIVASLFGMILRFDLVSSKTAAGEMLVMIVIINIVLALFNLIPLPPLDGSKILFSLLSTSPKLWKLENWLTQYQFILFLVIIFLAGSYLALVVPPLFRLLTGISL